MTLRLRKSEVAASHDLKVEPAPTTIAGWLAMLSKMLPRAQAESVRDELEGHLTDRVRDLMVGGMTENEATRRAIEELGEAADMAARYRSLQTEPRRRLVMYGSIFAVCGAALALSITAISGGKIQPEKAQAGSEVAVKALLTDSLLRLQPEERAPLIVDLLRRATPETKLDVDADTLRFVRSRMAAAAAGDTTTYTAQPVPSELAGSKFDADFKETSATDVFEFVGTMLKKPVRVYWPQVQEVGIQQDSSITFKAQQAGIDAVIRAVNDLKTTRNSGVDWRLTNGVLEISNMEYFDRREVKLSIYDLSGIIAQRHEAYSEDRAKVVEEVTMLIREFVYAEGWRDNGGDLAKMTIVGDRMFVEAPERYHAQIKWMLEQLPSSKKHGAAPARTPAGESVLKRYALKNADASTAADEVRAILGRMEPEMGGLTVDARTNSLLVQGTEAQQRAVAALLQGLDTKDVWGKREGTEQFHLKSMAAEPTAALLGQVFNVSPALKECAVERALVANSHTNSVVLKATLDQIGTVAELLALIDREAPAELPAPEEARKDFVLKAATPTAVREVLSGIFNESPRLKQCAVGRSMECNDNDRTFGFVATKDQVDIVGRLVALIDRPGR